MSRIPLNDGEHIIIDIPRERPSGSQSPSGRKGIVKARSGTEELGRRRLKKGGNIRFWDFGQYLNGTSIYHSFINANEDYGAIGDIFDLISDINTEVLGVTDPFSAFMPLDKAGAVSRELLLTTDAGVGRPAELTGYTGNSLAMTQEGLAALRIDTNAQFFSGFSNLLITDWPVAFKITTLPDYDAAAVDFTPTPNMDIGLLPLAALQSAEVVYDGVVERLNEFYSIIPRSVAPLLRSDEAGLYGSQYDWWRAMRLSPDARAHEVISIGVISPISPSAFAPASNYPAPPAEPDISDTYNTILGQGIANPPGTLVAIIRKGGQMYYVWVA